jgi:hypothetical protein
LGSWKKDIVWFLDAIHGIADSNITIYSMCEFGLDLYNVAHALSNYHGTRCVAKKDNRNETKDMVKDLKLQDSVEEAAALTMKAWNRNLPNKVSKVLTPKMEKTSKKTSFEAQFLSQPRE